MHKKRTKKKEIKITSHKTPSTTGGWAGRRRIHIEALPLHKATAQRWNRWRMDSAGGTPKRWPWRRPILVMVSAASLLQPPRDSTTKGTNAMPAARQATAWAASFLSAPTTRAWPCVEAPPCRVDCWRVDMTVTPGQQVGPSAKWGERCQRAGWGYRESRMVIFRVENISYVIISYSFNFVRSPCRIQNTCENFVVEKYSYV